METLNNILPRITILKFLDLLLEIIAKDYEEENNKENTLLFFFFGGMVYKQYDFFKQAVQMFTKEEFSNRRIECNLGFNLQRASLPTIHILLGNEGKGPDGLGVDEGYQEELYEQQNTHEDIWRSIYTRSYDANYQLLITSDNATEAEMIYHFLKFLITSVMPEMDLAGIENISLGGQEISLAQDLIPAHIFSLLLNISFMYEQHIPKGKKDSFIKKFNIKAKSI